MLMSEYLASYTILTDAQANTFPFLLTEGRDLVQQIMLLKYGNREITENSANLQTTIQTYINTAVQMHFYNWTKKYNTIQLVYEPLRATDYTDNSTDTNSGSDTQSASDTHGGTDTTTDSGSVTKNDNVKHSARSYDNNTMTETENDATTGTDTTSATSALQHGETLAHSETQNFGHVLNHTRTVQGRENLTPQEMIKQEREIAEYNFYEMIADELTDYIADLSYYFEPIDTTGTEFFNE